MMTMIDEKKNTNVDANHTPVMVKEVVKYLLWDNNGLYIDATVGLGGHTAALAEHLGTDGRIIAVDRDEASLNIARTRLSSSKADITFCKNNFKNLPLILNRLGIRTIHGILLDLGVSSYQLLSPERGFSFQNDGPLDMRMDTSQATKAASLVNNLREKELADILYNFGGEKRSRFIARKIVEERNKKRITSTRRLAEIVESAVGTRKKGKIHPATKTFQALRIAVNNELEGLKDFILRMENFLIPGGTMVIISFHSLEDRIVKRSFQLLAGRCVCRMPRNLCTCPRTRRVKFLTPKGIKPSNEEIEVNPRSRSARLRAIKKLVQ